MSEFQCDQFLSFFTFKLPEGKRVVFHHGDCVGADRQAHIMVRALYGPSALIVVHPPIDSKKRAFSAGDIIRERKPYIERNHDIVDDSHYLLAAPLLPEEQQPRSGTWETWRYAEGRATRILLER
jgi:hypothetical protein